MARSFLQPFALSLLSLASSALAQQCNPGFAYVASASLCQPCTATGSFSFGGSATACATCAAGETFVSAAAGCAPTQLASAGAPALFVAGQHAAALASSALTAPVLDADAFGRAGAAIKVNSEWYVTGALPQLPTGNNARTIAAWVKCAAPTTPQGPTFLELGGADNLAQRQTFSLRAGGAASVAALVQPQYTSSVIAGPSSSFTPSAALGGIGFADGVGTNALFNNIVGIAIGPKTGNLYVTDRTGAKIRVIVPSTGSTTTLAGCTSSTTTCGNGFVDNAFGTSAKFGFLLDIAVDATETFVLVSDGTNNRIRKVVIATGYVTTVVGGNATSGDGVGTSAGFSFPCGLALDNNDDGTIKKLYIVEQQGLRVRSVEWATMQVTTIGGSGVTGYALTPGGALNTSSQYATPAKGAVLSPDKQSLFVIEQGNFIVRRINLTTLADSVFLGRPTISGAAASLSKLGSAPGTSVGNVQYGSFDSVGHFFVGDNSNSRIYKVAPSGALVGIVVNALGLADGVGTSIQMNGIGGIAVDNQTGVVYTAEYAGCRVRRLTPPTQHAVTFTAPVCDSKWHHVLATLGGGSAAVFVDGQQRAASANLWANTNNESPTQLRIAGARAATEPFVGSIADVRVYNSILNADQALALAQPALPSFANAAMTLTANALNVTSSIAWTCLAGFAGAPLTLARSPSDGSWGASGGALALANNSSPLLAGNAMVCTICPAGSSCRGDGLAQQCPPGAFAAGNGSAVCSPCASGSFAAAAGAAFCAPCSVCGDGYSATTCSAAANAQCTVCTAGTAAVAGSPNCTACVAGQTYASVSGQSACIACSSSPPGSGVSAACTATSNTVSSPCAPGRFSPGGGAACLPCASGSFSTSAGTAACTPFTVCPPGSFASTPGTATADTVCSSCAAGSFSALGASACTACAAGSFAPAAGATSCMAWATCAAGSYVSPTQPGSATADRFCVLCGAGSSSTGGAATAC